MLLTRPTKSKSHVPELVNAVQHGLSEGLGNDKSVAAVAAPQFTEDIAMRLSGKPRSQLPDLSKWLPPLGYWFDEDVLLSVSNKHPRCDLIVSMVGLPSFPAATEADEITTDFGTDGRPQLAVVHGPLPAFRTLYYLFKQKALVAAVASEPCKASVYPDDADGALRSAFKKTHALITRENLPQAARQCPNLVQQKNRLEE